MVQLLLKDLRIQRRFIGLGAIFVGVFFFALGAFEGMPLAVPAAIFAHFLIVTASKLDEKNNNGRMLVSFPLRRQDIVTAKYVGIAVFMGIAFVSTALWRVLSGLVLPSGELPWFDMRSVLLALMLLLLFYAVYFPLFFALGSRLAQVLDLIVIAVLGGATVLALRIGEWAGVNAGARIAELASSDASGWLLWGAGGCLGLLVLSWLLSLALYERRNV